MVSRVVVIDVDSLRPDHISGLGYSKETTPHIDSLIADGVSYTNAFAANTPCIPSRAGLLTARHGIHNGVVTHGSNGMTLNNPAYWEGVHDDVDRREWQLLPELLYHHRIPSVAVSTFPRHPAPWFTQNWHAFYQPQEPTGPNETFATPRAEDVIDTAINAVEQGDPEFLYVQLWNPHIPYNRTESQVEEFRGEYPHPHPTESQITNHPSETPASAAARGIESRSDVADLVAGYDAEIAHADEHIGRLLNTYKDRGWYDDTMFILTADHGEAFGEHGVYQHHAMVHDQTQRVPLVIVHPDVPTQTSDALVMNLDIAPTVTEFMGVDAPKQWQGQSLFPLLFGEQDKLREYVVLEHGLYTAQRAVRTERWKLIDTLHGGAWDIPEKQLYDMHDDPWEQANLASSRNNVVNRLERVLSDWKEGRQSRYQQDPLAAVAQNGPSGWRFWKEWEN